MSEISPKPPTGVITYFEPFEDTSTITELDPKPPTGVITRFTPRPDTGTITPIVPKPSTGVIVRFAPLEFKRRAYRHIGLIRGARGVG